MKRAIFLISILFIFIFLAVIKILSDKSKEGQAAATPQNPAIPVEVYRVNDTSVQYVFTTIGTIRANESVNIVGEINRKIINIFFKEGSYVSKGQLLFKLDDADIVARINKLKVELKLASERETREKALLEKGGISQEQYDIVSNHVHSLNADIAVITVDLGKTEIKAPFSGKIGLRNVSEGALVSPEMVLATLNDINRVKIDFSIPERYANDLKPGAKVTFTTDYLPQLLTCTVESIEPTVDLNTRTIKLRAVSQNPQGKLVPGSSIKVNLDILSMNKSLFVPTSALIPTLKGYSVYKAKSGKAVLQEVKTGIRNSASIQILDGLLPGDSLVTTNLLRIRAGASLKIIKLL